MFMIHRQQQLFIDQMRQNVYERHMFRKAIDGRVDAEIERLRDTRIFSAAVLANMC